MFQKYKIPNRRSKYKNVLFAKETENKTTEFKMLPNYLVTKLVSSPIFIESSPGCVFLHMRVSSIALSNAKFVLLSCRAANQTNHNLIKVQRFFIYFLKPKVKEANRRSKRGIISTVGK